MATKTNSTPVKKLTPKQEQFCYEYIIDFNATQAAERAGYSKKTAGSQGHDLLKKPEIQAFISELTQKRLQRASKSADDVVKELENIGFARVGNVVEWNESGASFIKNSDDISDEAHAAIESIEVTEDMIGSKEDTKMVQKTKVKLHSKTKALEMLCKHHKVFPDSKSGDINLNGPITVNVVDFKEKD